nr:hypothetical protein [Bacteroidota bacterium]
MTLSKCYQYISLNQDVQNIFQIIKKASGAGICTILDVEDSIEIPLHPERTKILKALARENLEMLLDLMDERNTQLPLSIRINMAGSEQFDKDIVMLNALAERLVWRSIVLPKTASTDYLQETHDTLKKVRYHELVIIAETADFFVNAQSIVKKCDELKIKKIQFGHWDYFYSVREFPTPLPDNVKLWEMVKKILKLIEGRDIEYVHTPYCFLFDHEGFHALANYLYHLAGRPIGLLGLTFSQCMQIMRQVQGVSSFNPRPDNYSREQKIEMAQNTIDFFENKNQEEFSFNIKKENHQFVAPHEYLGALHYLSENE